MSYLTKYSHNGMTQNFKKMGGSTLKFNILIFCLRVFTLLYMNLYPGLKKFTLLCPTITKKYRLFELYKEYSFLLLQLYKINIKGFAQNKRSDSNIDINKFRMRKPRSKFDYLFI